jgi:carbon monoxide dehydrogenase subunit G
MTSMTTIIRTISIDVDPAEAWAALSDFGALDKRLVRGFVTDCTLDEPDVRTITFFNGAVAKERLVGTDERARRLAYTVVESGLKPTHHSVSVRVHEDHGRTRFEWTTDVLPDGIAPTIADLMDRGIEAIKWTLERTTIHDDPSSVVGSS